MPRISQYPSQSGAAVANGDLIPIVDVGSPNVTERIAVDELAQAPQFSSRYKPLASDTIWISAPQMSATQGSPSLGSPSGFGYWAAWRLDADAAVETIAGSFVVPPGWVTANVDLYWFNHGTGSGNVHIGMTYRVDMTAGSNLNNNVTDSTAQTVTAGLQNILVVTRMVTGWSLPAAGRVTNIAPYRLGSNVADTLANDIGVLGVLVTRAS